MVTSEKKPEKPLDNPEVKELLKELKGYPKKILYGNLPRGQKVMDGTRKAVAQQNEKPQNKELKEPKELKVGLQLLKDNKFPEAAQEFLNAFTSNPINGTAILNCGASFWFGVKKYLDPLSAMCFGACRSGAFHELFLAYLLNPTKFPGRLFAQQLRKTVSTSELNRLHNCLHAAELCFKTAYDLGDKGTALIWLVTLTRGTGHYNECRDLILKASADSSISPKEIAEAKKYTDSIKMWELDLTDIDNATGGWIIPKACFLTPEVLSKLEPIAENINETKQGYLKIIAKTDEEGAIEGFRAVNDIGPSNRSATKRSGEKHIKSKRHELDNVWWILPKGSRKEGPFSLNELRSVYRKSDKKSGMKVRKGSADKWYSWINAGDVYPELNNRDSDNTVRHYI